MAAAGTARRYSAARSASCGRQRAARRQSSSTPDRPSARVGKSALGGCASGCQRRTGGSRSAWAGSLPAGGGDARTEGVWRRRSCPVPAATSAEASLTIAGLSAVCGSAGAGAAERARAGRAPARSGRRRRSSQPARGGLCRSSRTRRCQGSSGHSLAPAWRISSAIATVRAKRCRPASGAGGGARWAIAGLALADGGGRESSAASHASRPARMRAVRARAAAAARRARCRCARWAGRS